MPSISAFLRSKSQSSSGSPHKGENFVNSAKHTSRSKFSISSKVSNSRVCKLALKLLKYKSQINSKYQSRSASPPPPSSSNELNDMKSMIKDLKKLVNEQQGFIQKVSDSQQEITKELSQIQTTMSSISRKINQRATESYTRPGPSSISTLAYDINDDHGRNYVDDKKNCINIEFDKLVGNVDDLVNEVKGIRLDVTHRGIEPLPRKLQTISKDMALAEVKMNEMREVLNNENPIWNKIWDSEIQRVRDDREYMRIYNGLVDELQEDITKASRILSLVKSVSKVQKNPSKSVSRVISRE